MGAGARISVRSATQLKGYVGEIYAGMDLQNLAKLTDCRFFHNVRVLAKNGDNDAQIDFVLLSTKGFYCIEVKNWYCEQLCVGNADSKYWTAKYKNRIISVENPLFQNRWHIDRMSELTGSTYENLVLYTNSATLVDNTIPNVLYVNNLTAYILGLPDIYDRDYVIKESYKVYELKQEGICR